MPRRGRGKGRRGRGRGPHPRWGRRKRILQPLILLLLAEEATHGYGLVERLTSSYKLKAVGQQTVYRALRGMEEAGWIAPSWDTDSGQGPPRKIYQVTTEGYAALEEWSQDMEELRNIIDLFLSSYDQFSK